MFSKKRIAISLVLLLGFVLSACGGATPTATVQTNPTQQGQATTAPATDDAPVVAEPQTIIIGLAGAPLSLDPADHRDRVAETVIRNMFDGLVTRDNVSGVHMELATDITWTDDTTLAITLREGVKFHDGTEMTADDVVFTFDRVIQENAIEYPEAHTSPRKGLIAPLLSIEKTGDYAVVMHFSAPFPTAMQMLVHQQIVSKAYLDAVGTEGFIAAPIGTGPFKFVSAQPGLTEIVMEKFADYYGGAPDLTPVGPACVDTVVFRVIPEASTRVAALLAGEVDIIQSVPAELVSTLEQVPGIQIKTTPGTTPLWMEMNVNKAPFDDVRVRQAMNYAIDKDLLVEAIYGGKAEVLPGALSPNNNFADQTLKPYAYDTVKALELLAAAGWTDSNADTMLDKNGANLTFTIDTEEKYRSISEAVANQLRAIGIDASVRIWEYSVVTPLLKTGERMAFLDGWGDSAFDPVGHMEAKWHSLVTDTPYGRGNFSGYANARVDELIVQGETTVDVAARHTIYDEAQQLIYADAPAVFLVLPDVVEAASARVLNWNPASDSRINLHDVCLEK